MSATKAMAVLESIGDAREHVAELINNLANAPFVALQVAFADKSVQ
jgi:hypothetical protein